MPIKDSDLQERRKLVAEEGDKIDAAISGAQAVINAETKKIHELVGLKNINAGILGDIDHWISKLEPVTGFKTVEEKPA